MIMERTNTTTIAGTFGYLAPEYFSTGKATTSTDVYSFRAFLREVVLVGDPWITKKKCVW